MEARRAAKSRTDARSDGCRFFCIRRRQEAGRMDARGRIDGLGRRPGELYVGITAFGEGREQPALRHSWVGYGHPTYRYRKTQNKYISEAHENYKTTTKQVQKTTKNYKRNYKQLRKLASISAREITYCKFS